MSAPGARQPFHARGRVLPMGAKTYVMSIINLTDDSFSGDGVGGNIDAAVRKAVTAQEDGADIVDVGAESARADVPVRDAGEEAAIVGEAVRRISAETDIAVSADTYKGEVAEAALQAGAHIINDIGGFMHDIGTAKAAARYGAGLVINYTYERPKVRPAEPPRYDDLIGQHLAFLRDRISKATACGAGSGAIVIDPGIAFGKSHDEDLEVLRRLGEFRQIGPPILVAASRKHFMGTVLGLGPEDRGAATVAVTALAVAGGADIVRVHEVGANVQAARIADAIVRGRAGEFAASPASWPWASDAAPIPGTTISGRQEGPNPR
ncbi:MAG: dihydropteroate synthase [Chloroflexi bacterium]|nr:dihydropteroate synthase [Chloroflexota bacterium]